MKYFAKYLPVEGEIKEGWKGIAYKKNVKGQFFEHFYTTNPWYADAKPCKLFLCSRDIQVGDKVWFLDPNPNVGGFNDWSGFGTIFEIEDGMYGVDLGHTTTWEGIEDFAKVIGEILTPGIVENQEFTEKEAEYLTIGEKY